MNRSVRLAAKAHNVAIVFLLVCATGMGVITILATISPMSRRFTNGLFELFLGLLGVAFVIMVATGFHIAIVDALGRIERRDKKATSDESL